MLILSSAETGARTIATDLQRYGFPVYFYLLIPALAATVTWVTGLLVVSLSPGELGPLTPSYGAPLPWISVGYVTGCLAPTPQCYTYNVNWVSLALDLLLYSTVSVAATTLYLRTTRRPFPLLLARRVDRRAIETMLLIGLVTIASAPVVAGAMLPRLPCISCTPSDSIIMISFQINSPANVTLSIRNTGSTNVGLVNYEAQDSQGNQWWRIWLPPNQTTGTWWSGPIINPNTTKPAIITIGSSCSNCTYKGTTGAFNQFNPGNSYSITVMTGKNYQVNFEIKA